MDATGPRGLGAQSKEVTTRAPWPRDWGRWWRGGPRSARLRRARRRLGGSAGVRLQQPAQERLTLHHASLLRRLANLLRVSASVVVGNAVGYPLVRAMAVDMEVIDRDGPAQAAQSNRATVAMIGNPAPPKPGPTSLAILTPHTTGICRRVENTTRGAAGASWGPDEFLDTTGPRSARLRHARGAS